jgi:hypothetical protein
LAWFFTFKTLLNLISGDTTGAAQHQETEEFANYPYLHPLEKLSNILNQELKNEIQNLDEDFVCHMGVENVVLTIFERNYLKTSETQKVVLVFLQEIGFSENVATILQDNFMDPEIVHYTNWNWVFAFLRLKLYPVEPLQAYPYCKETVGNWINIEGTDPPVNKSQFWENNDIQIINIDRVSLDRTLQQQIHGSGEPGN